MTLDEAIKHAKDIIKVNENTIVSLETDGSKFDNWVTIANCEKCAIEHRQLVEWLEDYQRIKKEDRDRFIEDFQFLMTVPPSPCRSCGAGIECVGCPPKREWDKFYGEEVKKRGLEKNLYNILRIKEIKAKIKELQKEQKEICETDSLIRNNKEYLL